MNQVILFLLIIFLSFKYKASITGNTYNVGVGEADYNANKVGKNKTEIVIPLKHLSNFCRALNIPLINCEVELILAVVCFWATGNPFFVYTLLNHKNT